MTQNQALYQAKLILDYMPEEDYKKIPEEIIKYIYDNMEEDKNIVVNPDIPLEEQDIDEKTYDFLDKVIKKIEYSEAKQQRTSNEVKELSREELINLLERYKQENSKIGKAKNLIIQYKQALEQKDREIVELKEVNQDLYSSIQKCPKIIKRLFFRKMERKLLK
ncbi:MAG: hypothetical protein IJJ82_04000 [Clostridia bacterium]|nr:hypothetical protein [Clostridia bacterium]